MAIFLIFKFYLISYNYIPKRGDIFLWYGKRVDKKGVSHYSGHTGVVINYNSESDGKATLI